MRHVFEITLLWLALGPNTLPAQIAPDGTPERAIQDMLLASKPEDVEKHLPIATLDAIKGLEPDDRGECEATLLLQLRQPGEKAKFDIPEDGHAFAVMQLTDMQELQAQLTDTITTGADAVLRFTLRWQVTRSSEVLVWTRFEDGEWRIRELSPGVFGAGIRFDSPDFVERFRNRRQKQNESATVSTLYTLGYALRRYAEFRPDVGFPDDLSALAEPLSADADDASATDSFLDTDMAHNDFVHGGYHYRYQPIHSGPQGSYRITARPVDPGKSGRFAYFTDESQELHQTREDREATLDDPLVGSGD